MKKRGCAKGSRRDSSGDCRDYAAETRYESSPEQKRNRAARNKANRALLPGHDSRGQEVDHRRALAEGGSNSPSNWRVTSVHENRGEKAARTRQALSRHSSNRKHPAHPRR